jgi:hypothetical protein
VEAYFGADDEGRACRPARGRFAASRRTFIESVGAVD